MTSASSWFWPDFDSARMTSPSAIMPRSPWLASLACTKKAGAPVEAKVAAIFLATCPDLPMPVQITRPLAANSRSTAFSKASPRVSACRRRASASAVSTRRPTATASNLVIWAASVISWG